MERTGQTFNADYKESHLNDPVVREGPTKTENVYKMSSSIVQKTPAHDLYTMDSVIAHGTFGVVYTCSSQLNPSLKLACKRVFQDARYKNREIEILLQLLTADGSVEVEKQVHPNILDCICHYYTNGERPGDKYLNIVSSHMPHTIGTKIKQHAKQRTVFSLVDIKLYAFQLLRAVAFMHSRDIAHRDIKPQNVLIDPTTGALRLCDFGAAKQLDGNKSISYICSRHYRAPELIFGNTRYDQKIDVWSVGCVIAEMFKLSPFFPGASSQKQILEIFKVLGTPSSQEVLQLAPDYPNKNFPAFSGMPLEQFFPSESEIDDEAVDLMRKMFIFDPAKRIDAIQALAHPFFDQLKQPNCKLSDGGQLPEELLAFTQEEYDCNPYVFEARIIPNWLPTSTNQHLARGENRKSIREQIKQKQNQGKENHQQNKGKLK